jgi:uncharacterized membrane protein YvbJ
MENKFINCPKCGTRNFADDTVCGVCKTKLNSSVNLPQTSVDNKAPQKTNYFVLILIFGGLIALYYNIFHKEKETASPDTQMSSTNYQTVLPEYTLLKSELNNKRAFNVAVRIDTKISDYQLKSLAQKIKSDINAVSEKGVVFFLLPEMEIDNGAWAAVDFYPELKVRIIGQSITDEQKVKSGLEHITDYVGLWLDNGTEGDVIIRIRKDKLEGYVFEYISPSDPKPSNLATPLIKTKKNGKTIFKDTEHPEQFFLLENNGDLSVYDNYGFVATYKKLK